MSWSVAFTRPVSKRDAEAELDRLKLDPSTNPPECEDQLHAARLAAKRLLHSIPGPYVMVSLSGHANGIGWQKKEGYANDTIQISVTQHCEDDLKYYANR